jgi:DNA-binding transcriptional regulator YhcF (GntR family)
MSAHSIKSPTGQTSQKKWGKETIKLGFCVIPSLLLRAQKRLGLSPTQLNILLIIIDHWWKPSEHPFPSKKTVAEKISISPRQVQRQITELESRGYIRRVTRYRGDGGKSSNGYDLSGLVNELKRMAPEFEKMAEEVKKMKKDILKPGLRITKVAQ